MYIEKKKIGGRTYNYLRISVRTGDKVKTKTVAYLGKDPMTEKQIRKKIAAIPKSIIETAKKELKEQIGNDAFLSHAQIETLNEIKKGFSRKIKIPDRKLIADMFTDFKTHYVYNTTALEGNTISLAETNLLLNKDRVPAGKDLWEIHDHINEKDTFEYILEKKPDVKPNLIIDIHARLLKSIDKRTGGFRTHNVRVFGADFDTSPAAYVEADMKNLLRWYQKSKKRLHPLILAAIFHEKFEKIHPFYDGNGRTGRMILNLMLLRDGFPPLIIKNSARKEYYDALTQGHRAELTKVDPKQHHAIVHFCYGQLVDTYEKIFGKWGG